MQAAWLILAVLLDLLAGDPRWLPHPVRAMAALAERLEAGSRRLLSPRLAGAVTVLLVLAAVVLAGQGTLWLAVSLHPWLGNAAAILLLYTTVALRDLLAHSRRVHAALAADDLARARQEVAMIVGRDTGELDREGVVRAAVESVAESLADGVVAPLFYAALGGPVAALAYKAVNTMDSLFGYRNDRYREFGWSAARLDDLAGFLPARLSALLLVAVAPLAGCSLSRAWRILWRDRFNHPSPNSGHPEAAMAGALGIRLAGPASYFGRKLKKPFIGEPLMTATPGHILQANRLTLLSGLAGALLLAGLRALLA